MMNRPNQNLFRIFFAFSDIVILNVINLILLKAIRLHNYDGIYDYTVFCFVNNTAWLICAYLSSVYINNNTLDFRGLFKRTLVALFLLFLIDEVFFIFYPIPHYWQFLTYSLAGFTSFIVVSRLAYIYLVYYLNNKGTYKKNVALIGYNKVARQLVKSLTKDKTVILSGYFDDQAIDIKGALPILGSVKDCISMAIANDINEIYATVSPETNPDLYILAEQAERNFIRFKFIPDLKSFVNRDYHIDFVGEGTPTLALRSEPLERLTGKIKKRVFDVIFSLLVIVFVLSWLLPLLAILIKLDSAGPVFFTQARSGKNNQPFTCIKLRSLTINEEADSKQVSRDDTRITRLGRFLRKSNLDEFPQFFNVLVGNMSIVGARPHMLKHTEEYAKIQSNYMVRHFLKPGVTGWAQVNGFRGEIKEKAQLSMRIEHDIWYLENWNIWLDVRIIFSTFFSTIKGDKNAF